MEREFNVGDMCRIRQWDDMAAEYGTTSWGAIKCRESFTKEMRYLCGESFTVRHKSDGLYFSEERVEGAWNISGDMLELAYEETSFDFDSTVDLLTFIKGE